MRLSSLAFNMTVFETGAAPGFQSLGFRSSGCRFSAGTFYPLHASKNRPIRFSRMYASFCWRLGVRTPGFPLPRRRLCFEIDAEKSNEINAEKN